MSGAIRSSMTAVADVGSHVQSVINVGALFQFTPLREAAGAFRLDLEWYRLYARYAPQLNAGRERAYVQSPLPNSGMVAIHLNSNRNFRTLAR